jgi:hypothetical protein
MSRPKLVPFWHFCRILSSRLKIGEKSRGKIVSDLVLVTKSTLGSSVGQFRYWRVGMRTIEFEPISWERASSPAASIAASLRSKRNAESHRDSATVEGREVVAASWDDDRLCYYLSDDIRLEVTAGEASANWTISRGEASVLFAGAFLRGDDPVSRQNFDHRRTWIGDRLEEEVTKEDRRPTAPCAPLSDACPLSPCRVRPVRCISSAACTAIRSASPAPNHVLDRGAGPRERSNRLSSGD